MPDTPRWLGARGALSHIGLASGPVLAGDPGGPIVEIGFGTGRLVELPAVGLARVVPETP